MEQNLTFDGLPKAVTMLTKEVSEIKRLLIEKQERIPTKDPEQLLTVSGLAKILDLSKATIYTKHSKGELPGGCKRGKRLYFQHDVILNWLKEGRQKSNVELQQEAESYLDSKK
ncbi:helix-turn-helix transcriptional regulator [Flagellimonas aurea]|uniref:helix-turn-helix transcriptional regulator n=1 Tax=Flagellimonas aurea TaxID=2915619 RepID=UPI0035CFF46D